MKASTRLESWVLRLTDTLFARLPRERPPTARLRGAKIVAHRGVHDNRRRMENTLDSFEAAVDEGLWGVELDIRWTRDRHAVVCHDPDLRRVFGIPAAVHTLTLEQLRRRCPAVPALETVVDRFAGRLHLMIELKNAALRGQPYPYDRLAGYLADMCPGRDYHLMALTLPLLAGVDWAPEACLPIARLKGAGFSKAAVESGYGGLCGHYALLRRGHLRRHRRCGQKIGTGFIASRACLYREVSRGVAWLFSDRAAEMQRICREG